MLRNYVLRGKWNGFIFFPVIFKDCGKILDYGVYLYHMSAIGKSRCTLKFLIVDLLMIENMPLINQVNDIL